MPRSALTWPHPCDRTAAVPSVCKNIDEPPLKTNPAVELTSWNGGVQGCVLPPVVPMLKLNVADAGFGETLVRTIVDCHPPPSTTSGRINVCADCPNRGNPRRREPRADNVVRFMSLSIG